MTNPTAIFARTDVYLIDQILKGRYAPSDRILDAGCGQGRNIHWFYENGYDIWAVDLRQEAVQFVKELYPKIADRCHEASLTDLPFEDEMFDHVICNAVLHFAESHDQFQAMFSELVRVLKPGGSLFIRMTTDVGVTHTAQEIGAGVFYLKDDSHRYLITRQQIDLLCEQFNVQLIGPFKTTVVEDWRSMATIMLGKLER